MTLTFRLAGPSPQAIATIVPGLVVQLGPVTPAVTLDVTIDAEKASVPLLIVAMRQFGWEPVP